MDSCFLQGSVVLTAASQYLVMHKNQCWSAECHIPLNQYLFWRPSRILTLFWDTVSESVPTYSSHTLTWEGSMMVSAPPDLHSEPRPRLPPASNGRVGFKKKSIKNLPWNEIVALKNVYGFMHFMQRKVLEMYSHLPERHLKQKVESEVGIYIKVLLNFVMFPLCGMCCHCCWRVLSAG